MSCITFAIRHLARDEVEGKRVIEFGSLDVNGSLRPFIELLKPAKYVGIDIEKGPGVDIVCNAEDASERFGEESFDVVISTELLEHVKDWRKVVSNMKKVCSPNGVILVTTPSRGFHYHAAPYDFWRYEPADMQHVFSDCDIEKLEKNRESPGVCAKARKPRKFVETDLSSYELYSIVENKRIKEFHGRPHIPIRWFLRDRAVLLYTYARSILKKIIEL